MGIGAFMGDIGAGLKGWRTATAWASRELQDVPGAFLLG